MELASFDGTVQKFDNGLYDIVSDNKMFTVSVFPRNMSGAQVGSKVRVAYQAPSQSEAPLGEWVIAEIRS